MTKDDLPLSSSDSQSLQDLELAQEKCESEAFCLGKKPFTVFLAFLNAFVPISMALYLPSLPHITKVFETSRVMADLTISGFMFSFGLSMLFWGGLSDKYGRKPILNSGLLLYMLGSLVCVFSQSIYMLIMGRLLQAIGSGAIISVSMAIVKDVFKAKAMENILAAIQTMTVVCPMLAPILGAQLLKYTSWRGLFVALTLCSVLALLLSFCLKETLQQATKGGPFVSLGRIRVVMRNSGLRWLLLVFSLSSMPFMAYLNSSSFIYIEYFKLNPQQFSFFFSANAMGAMLGPILYLNFFRKLPRRSFLGGAFGIIALSGFLLLLFGTKGPFFFILLYIPITIAGSSTRAVGTVLMMSQLDTDSGVVASLVGSLSLLCGSISMQLCSLHWPNPIMPVGVIGLVIGVIVCSGWLFIDKTERYRDPHKEEAA